MPDLLAQPATVLIRRAMLADGSAILRLRNESSTVFWSRSRREITEGEHLRWWESIWQDRTTVVLVADEGEPIGVVRLDGVFSGSWPAVSIMVAQQSRGRHLAWQLLDAVVGEATQRGCRGIEAIVHRDNLISRRLFVGQGFSPVCSVVDDDWLTYNRELLARSLKREAYALELGTARWAELRRIDEGMPD